MSNVEPLAPSGAQLKLIVFDLDGVLINSLTVMRMAFEASLYDHFGKSLSPQWATELFTEYRKHLGKGFPHIMRALNLPQTLHEPFKRHSRYLARYVRPYSGVFIMLEGLRDLGLSLTVATGKDGERATELLEQMELASFFDFITGSNQVTHPKPSPEMVNLHLDRLQVSADQALIIGDAPADMECGQAAGIGCAAALWGYGSKQELTACHPDISFDNPEQVVSWARGLQQ